MQLPLAHHYSSKTEDELLALAAAQESLTPQARSLLREELRRRNIDWLALQPTESTPALTPCEPRRSGLRFWTKWLALLALNTLIATYGVLLTAGLTVDMWKPLVSHATKTRLVLTPYYPFTLIIGIIVGVLSYKRFRGSYRLWVWVVPAASLIYSMLRWKIDSGVSWAETLFHFFGTLPYPDNRDQLDTSLLVYAALAYMLGSWLHNVLRPMISDFNKFRGAKGN